MRVERTHLCRGALAVTAALLSATCPAMASVAVSAPPEEPPTGLFELQPATIDTLRTSAAGLGAVDDAMATGRSELVCVDNTGSYLVNPAKIADGVLDAADPEALVYADVDGSRRLVAVAWMSLSPAQVDGVPLHLDADLGAWVLHAWIGLDNPAGLLADRHPVVGACAAGVDTPSVPAGEPADTTDSAPGSGFRAGPPDDAVAAPLTGVFELPGESLDLLRSAFAGFDDPAGAEAAGWPASGQCLERTGWLFTDRTTIFDGVLDPARPELLVYADVDGATRLAAVGWAASAPAQVLGVPLHLDGDLWVLYAWIGLDNPAGTLANRHPDIAPCSDGLAAIDDLDDLDDVDESTPSGSSDGTASAPADEPTTTAATTTTSTTSTTSTTTVATTTSSTAAPTTSPGGFPFTLSATTVDFGTVQVGTTTGTFISITNTDTVARSIAIAHEPTGSRFPVDSNCSGIVDPGVSCRVSYSFAPTSELMPFSVTTSFRLAAGGGQVRDFTITLRGEAVAPGGGGPGPTAPTSPPVVDPGLAPDATTGG